MENAYLTLCILVHRYRSEPSSVRNKEEGGGMEKL